MAEGIIAAALRLVACAAILGAAPAVAQMDKPTVIVAEATELSFPLTLEALGTARANESIDVRAQVVEVVTAIHFEEGERVEAGRILVELEDSEAVADVAAVRARLVDLESRLRRTRELFETRAVAPSTLDQRLAERDAARAGLAAAQARLAQRRIRAPFAGRVGLRRISVGSLVSPDVVITTLDDTDVIKLDFDLPATALGRIEVGLPISARSAAWPDEVFEGRVGSIDTRVDPVSRTIAVRALVPNEAGRIRPGMFLRVDVLREDVTALVVPESAIVPEQSRQFVFVVDEAGRVSEREVGIGRRRPGEVEILAGLEAGERVIAEGTHRTRPGGTVEIVGEWSFEAARTGAVGP